MSKNLNKNSGETFKEYNASMHNLGRLSTFSILLILFLAPVVFCIALGTAPDWNRLLKPDVIGLILTYFAIGVIEAISYAPLLGTGGQYLSFITGNISNLKLPCAINTQQISKVEKGSEQEEIITTIAIAISSIVTTIIITLGVALLLIPGVGTNVTNMLRPVTPYVLPAIFGGLLIGLLSMYLKQTAIPFIAMLIINTIIFALGKDLGQSTM
ncbi:MAG: hypothetical protein EOM87_02990, partial [Clostridia bacterium]|nr:hypothetical protein [Clostridia bacterium]